MDLDLIVTAGLRSGGSDQVCAWGGGAGRRNRRSAVARGSGSPEFMNLGAPRVKSTRAWVWDAHHAMRDRPRATARVGGAQAGGFNCGGGSERQGSLACARSSIVMLRIGCIRVMAHARGQGKSVQGVRGAGLCCRGSATAEQRRAQRQSAGALCPGRWSGLRAKTASLKGRGGLGGAHRALDWTEAWRRVDGVDGERRCTGGARGPGVAGLLRGL